MGPSDAGEAVFTVPDFGGLDDLGVAVLALLAVVVVVVVVIPLVLFGIELILLGLVLAAGIAGRTLLGRPWVVHAAPLGGKDEQLAWRVVGWSPPQHALKIVLASNPDGPLRDQLRGMTQES